MIKTAGANVSPREVEAAILEVSGLVAHVVGIDDEARGQLVAALVRAPEGSVDVDELRCTPARSALGLQGAAPGGRRSRRGRCPMMSSGKLDLRALKELLSVA